MIDHLTPDLFFNTTTKPGSMGCRAEIAATLSHAMKLAGERGISREEIASRMSLFLGEKISVATLNGYSAQSHTSQATEHGEPARDISLMRAMAFDAAVGEDVLLGMFAEKLGGRRVVNRDEAALLEWATLHQEEKALGERKRILEAVLKVKGGRK
jgi:hypothetical protein